VRPGGKSRRRQASVNGDVVSNAFCSRTVDRHVKHNLKGKNNVREVDLYN